MTVSIYFTNVYTDAYTQPHFVERWKTLIVLSEELRWSHFGECVSESVCPGYLSKVLSTVPGALLPGGCSRISKWAWPHLAACDWLSQGHVLLDPIKMFAFKLKHFEFLLHPHVSGGRSHTTLSAQKVEGSFPRPCHQWCLSTLSLSRVLSEPCCSGGTPTSTLQLSWCCQLSWC